MIVKTIQSINIDQIESTIDLTLDIENTTMMKHDLTNRRNAKPIRTPTDQTTPNIDHCISKKNKEPNIKIYCLHGNI